MMTSNEIKSVLDLIVKLEASNGNHDVIVAVTEFIKGANPHSLTCQSVLDLEEVLSDHLDTMNYWDNDEGKLSIPSIYSL